VTGTASRVAPVVASTFGVGLGCVALAGAVAGAHGALGAAYGGLLVLAFLGGGVVPLKLRGLEQGYAALGLPLLLLGYTTRVAAAALVLAQLRDTDQFDRRAFGLTLLACAATWTLTVAVRVLRAPDDRPRPPAPVGVAAESRW